MQEAALLQHPPFPSSRGCLLAEMLAALAGDSKAGRSAAGWPNGGRLRPMPSDALPWRPRRTIALAGRAQESPGVGPGGALPAMPRRLVATAGRNGAARKRGRGEAGAQGAQAELGSVTTERHSRAKRVAIDFTHK